MMLFHCTHHQSSLTASLILALFLGVSCSQGPLQNTEAAPEKGDISTETLQLDYQDIPMGIIVTCSAPGDQEHLTVRETFQDTSHLSESNMRSFMETQTRLSTDTSHVSSGVPLVVNQPGGLVSSSTSQVVAMSENFSHQLVPESYSLNTDQVVGSGQPSQLVHQGVSQSSKGKSGKGGKGKGSLSVNQAGKVKGPAQGVNQGVSQGVNQGVSQGVNQGVHQGIQQDKGHKSASAGVAQGSFSSPNQFPAAHYKGYIPSQGKSSKASLKGPGQQHVAQASYSQLNSAGSGAQVACDQDHLSNHYRPSAVSSRLTPFRWGYYGAPRMISSGDRTYYIYSKPSCKEASWCDA